MRILLVEDDEMIGENLQKALPSSEFIVDWSKKGEHAKDQIRFNGDKFYDLCLLDLGLPGIDGIQVLRWIRGNKYDLPVIILTARDSVEDRVTGLDEGADDYMVKPFSFDELMARIRSVMRRRDGAVGTVTFKNEIFSLDPSKRQVRNQNGEVVNLTATEYLLLYNLTRRPGNIFSKDDLLAKLYQDDMNPDSNVIDFMIYSIRKKLGSKAIKNIRGLGWTVPE